MLPLTLFSAKMRKYYIMNNIFIILPQDLLPRSVEYLRMGSVCCGVEFGHHAHAHCGVR